MNGETSVAVNKILNNKSQRPDNKVQLMMVGMISIQELNNLKNNKNLNLQHKISSFKKMNGMLVVILIYQHQ